MADTLQHDLPATVGSPLVAKQRLFLWPIVLLALLLRVAVVAITAHSHTAHWFYNEATELGCLADSLLSGHGFSSPFGGSTGPSAFLAPGYPIFIAGIFSVFGTYSMTSAVVIMLIQACFGAATVLVLMRLTDRCFGALAANIAGLVWAVSLPLLFFAIIFWETSFSTLMLVSLPLLALRTAERPVTSRWMLMGALSLLALSVNPTLITVIFCCFVWAAWSSHSFAKSGLWITVLVYTLIFSLWPLRDYRVLHTFIPLRDNLGYELWQGNRPESNGFFDQDLHPNRSHSELLEYQSMGEINYMHRKGELAKAAIAANKPRFFALTAKRFVSFWAGSGPASVFLMVLYAVCSTIAGLAGLALLWRDNRRFALLFLGPLLLFPLPYYISHPDFRFRSVLDPLLIALAAYALTYRTRSKKPAAPEHAG